MDSATLPLTVYGSNISYFTGKLEIYLRLKGIPYRFQPMLGPRIWKKVERETGAGQMPAVELADGRWMVNSRVQGKGMRYVHISSDKGKNWTTKADPELIDPSCNGSIIRYTSIQDGHKKNRLLFSNAKSKEGRKNMTVRISYDEGKSWSAGKTIYTGGSAYSSLTKLKNGDIWKIKPISKIIKGSVFLQRPMPPARSMQPCIQDLIS